MVDERDPAVRAAAFAFLADVAQKAAEPWPPVLDRQLLAAGFSFGGARVPLLGPQGIFKPAVLSSMPLSITTVPPSLRKPAPYEDEFGYGHLVYRYRGSDPNHPDNRGLREAIATQTPLIYFHGVVPGKYLSVWPVYVVGDAASELAFHVAFDTADALGMQEPAVADTSRRAYAIRLVRQRLHQVSFRERVLTAYMRTCSVCHLRHQELLDAAHIIPDGRPRGDPIVPNGLALCKLHHSAFDHNIIGIRPDLMVEVRADVRRESDGPMLVHGLQQVHGVRIWIPRNHALRPGIDRLEERYQEFRRAG